MPRRPVVFIGCSSEALAAAQALQRNLDPEVEAVIWNQDVFTPSRSNLDNVLRAVKSSDFAVLLLTADDIAISRRQRKHIARENVTFELGMAFGALGPDRTFFVMPRGEGPTPFTDIPGIKSLGYSPPGEAGWSAALGPASSTIIEAIRKTVRSSRASSPVNPQDWTYHLGHTPLQTMYLRTAFDSEADLVERIKNARKRLNVFGLTRNFYISDTVAPLVREKAQQIPINMYLMDPRSSSRKERYRLEPIEAALEDPERYVREVLRPLRQLEQEVARQKRARRGAGLEIHLYNFPCSFAIEEFDDTACRVMLYGHGKRGTEGPILVFEGGTPYHDYFAGQIRWLEGLASGALQEPWRSKGVVMRRLADLFDVDERG